MSQFATTIENPILTTSIPDATHILNALRTHDNGPVYLAEQGIAEAQNELGYLYFNGESVPQNDYEAFKWF